MNDGFELPEGIDTCSSLIELGGGRRALAAIGLLSVAGSYASERDTGGLVEKHMLNHWGATSAAVDLVAAGHWLPVFEDGQFTGDYRFAEWKA